MVLLSLHAIVHVAAYVCEEKFDCFVIVGTFLVILVH
jgi:hypothetical protein